MNSSADGYDLWNHMPLSRLCEIISVEEVEDKAADAAEDEKAREKEPLTVEILKYSNSEKTGMSDGRIKRMVAYTTASGQEQQWNANHPNNDCVETWLSIHELEVHGCPNECYQNHQSWADPVSEHSTRVHVIPVVAFPLSLDFGSQFED